MQNRQERLAALNGESRVFVYHACSKVRHVKDAGARVRRTASIVCMPCINEHIRKIADAFTDNLVSASFNGREFYVHVGNTDVVGLVADLRHGGAV